MLYKNFKIELRHYSNDNDYSSNSSSNEMLNTNNSYSNNQNSVQETLEV